MACASWLSDAHPISAPLLPPPPTLGSSCKEPPLLSVAPVAPVAPVPAAVAPLAAAAEPSSLEPDPDAALQAPRPKQPNKTRCLSMVQPFFGRLQPTRLAALARAA